MVALTTMTLAVLRIAQSSFKPKSTQNEWIDRGPAQNGLPSILAETNSLYQDTLTAAATMGQTYMRYSC
ncbi:Activatory protein CHA4 [Fusarium oxysporum f. sp. albedinis]|nr:Activatory protein CHA4 [Fusarium oxysporum f. sp. albedinis]